MPLSKIVAKSITDDTITTDQIADTSVHGRRNLVINGAMQVAQRGTSFATMGNGDSQYTLDRFKWQEAGSTTAEMTVTQSSTSPNEFSKSMKVDVTTADTTLGANDLIYIQYKNEGNVLGGIAKGTSDAKPLTLSFYVRSNTTGTFVVYLFDVDNTRSVSGTYTINAADTWERKEVNFPADTSGALTIDNSHAMSINWVLGAGSNLKSSTLQTSWGSYDSTALATGSTDITGSTSNDLYITGVQLEVGNKATPFEHRSYGEELFACQRYYREYGGNSSNERVGVGFNNQTNQCRLALPLSPNMRTAPSESTSADSHWTVESGGGQYPCNAIGLDQASSKVASLNCTTSSSSLLNKGAGQLMGNTTSARLKLNAEL